MNKKGAILWWALFGLFAAFVYYLATTSDLEIDEKAKGEWQLEVMDTFAQSQVEQMKNEHKLQVAASTVIDTHTKDILKKDIGCGTHDKLPLLNKGDTFCHIDKTQEILSEFNPLAAQIMKVDYEPVVLDGSEFVGKARQRKNVIKKSSLNEGEAELIDFRLKYSYDPSFRIPASARLADLSFLFEEAQDIVTGCKNRKDLEKCLDDEKSLAVFFTSCDDSGAFAERGRKVLFCFEGEADNYLFALDFSPSTPFPIEELTVSTIGPNMFELSFKQDLAIELYTVYYTNWQEVSAPGSVQEIFFGIPSEEVFGMFYRFFTIENPLKESCPTSKELAVAYKCDDSIVVHFEDTGLTQSEPLLFAVTGVRDDGESLIVEFVSSSNEASLVG